MKAFKLDTAAVPAPYRILLRDAVIGVVLWLSSLLVMHLAEAEGEFVLFWCWLIPSGIFLYSYAGHYIIPKVWNQPRAFRKYLLRILVVLLFMFLPGCLLLLLFSRDEDIAIQFSIFSSLCHLLFTAPITWVIFRRRIRANAELYGLKTELGQSTASLDFLRSQINPHFLFNALNTLYGTALQENSERTAHGIQLLGDMMRFMLHENHQPKILLAREVEYLHNYLELQTLRTATSPNITIQARIDEVLEEKSIAPMLLIPFVENAFKHGISLQQQSWIRVSLHYGQNQLFFDVYNSVHTKQEQDLPKEAGVGLENVKQRLALLYPDKHELVIRQNPDEYFVHLTLQL